MFQKDKRPWLDESFEIEGDWWPNFADEKGHSRDRFKRHGKLIYSPREGASLKLYHEGPDLGWGTNIVFGGLGAGLFDSKVSCLGVRFKTCDSHSSTFSVDHIFKGFHLPPLKDAKFLELIFGLKNLNNWTHATGFKFKRLKRNSGFQVSYKESRGRWINVNDEISVRIAKWAHTPDEVGDFGQVGTTENIRLHIRAKKKANLSLEKIHSYLPKTEDFFALASGDLCNPHNTIVVGDFDYRKGIRGRLNPGHATLHSSGAQFDDDVFETPSAHYIFREEDMELPFAEHLRLWLGKYEQFRIPFALFRSAVFKTNSVEPHFLLLCQALESFHRNLKQGSYLPQDEYDMSAFAPLKAAIPKTLPRDLRTSLENRLKYGNEFALRKRIQGLLNEYGEAFSEDISIPPSLAKDIAEVRNYLTHFPNTGAPQTLELIRFYSTVLKSLFVVSLLGEIGFSKAHILRLAKKCERFRWLAYNAPVHFKTKPLSGRR